MTNEERSTEATVAKLIVDGAHVGWLTVSGVIFAALSKSSLTNELTPGTGLPSPLPIRDGIMRLGSYAAA